MQIVQADFEPATWNAWSGFVVEGRPAKEVAAELGLSVNAVYLAKGRVLARVREELCRTDGVSNCEMSPPTRAGGGVNNLDKVMEQEQDLCQ